MAEIGAIAEAQRRGNVFDRQIGIAQILDSDVHAQFIHQRTIGCIVLVQLTPQRSRAHAQVLRRGLEAGRAHQVDK